MRGEPPFALAPLTPFVLSLSKGHPEPPHPVHPAPSPVHPSTLLRMNGCGGSPRSP